MLRAAMLSALVAACAGCAARKTVRFVVPDFSAKAPVRVAVLPFDNESTDLVGPVLLRKLVGSTLAGRGYVPLPVEAVDEPLREIGVTDGGQLPAVRSSAVGEALGVEGLFYGVVENFSFTNLGYITQRLVRLRLWFVRASTGEKLWEDRGEGVTEDVAFKKKDAERKFAAGMAQHAAEIAMHSPLLFESRWAVFRALTSLPTAPSVEASSPAALGGARP